MKNILLIATYCDIDTNKNNRFTHLCDSIDKNSCSVKLITSSFNHTEKRQKSPVTKNEYQVVYIQDIGYKKNISISRILSIFIMSFRLKKFLNCCQPDIIYCSSPPISVSRVALKYSQKKEVPFVLDVQDLWPEAFEMVANNSLLSKLYSVLRRKIDYVYMNSSEVFTVSDTYSNRVNSVRTLDKAKTVYLGVDIGQYCDIKTCIENRGKNAIKLVYIGTLGHSYDIPTLLHAVEKLNLEGYIFDVTILGDGTKMNEFIDIKNSLKIKNVVFAGRKPYQEMVEIIKHCDIAVNPIVKGSAGSVINKVCDYAAAGLPVINSQENTEYRNLLVKYNAGINVDCENVQSMYMGIKQLLDDDNMRKCMSYNSRKMAEELFDRNSSYKEIVKVLEEL